MFITGENMDKPALMFGEGLREVERGALAEISDVGSIPGTHDR
jgi:hypothetical protein